MFKGAEGEEVRWIHEEERCMCGCAWLTDCVHVDQRMMWAQLRLSGYRSVLMNLVM